MHKNEHHHIDDHKEHIHSEQKKQSGSDFVYRLKYLNTLPPVPVDAKLLTFPLLPNRFVHYRLTSLEKNYIHDMPFNPREVMELDLIDWQKYHNIESDITFIDNSTRDSSTLNELDKELCTAIPIPNISTQIESIPVTEGLSAPNRPVVTWLRKSGTQLTKEKRQDAVIEEKKRTISARPMTLERAIEIIDKSFSGASNMKDDIQFHHPTYSNLTAKKCIPIYPDGYCWNTKFELMTFDNLPLDEKDQGIIKIDPSNSDDKRMDLYGHSNEQRIQIDTNQSIKKLIRQYSYTTRHYDNETKFFRLAIENDKASYVPLFVKNTLKRKAQQSSDNIPLLVVKRRSLNEEELKTKNNGSLNMSINET